MPRIYQTKTIQSGSEFDDNVIGLSTKDSTDDVRTDYYYHQDDSCYWAKEIDGEVMYSDDEVFSTEKEDATHIVLFMK